MEKQRHEELLNAIGQLKSVVEEQLAEIHDRIEHATEVIRENTEEIGALRDAIDEWRELFQWQLNNNHQELPSPFQLTSMPKDPAASDFAERLNRLSTADLPEEQNARKLPLTLAQVIEHERASTQPAPSNGPNEQNRLRCSDGFLF